METIVNVVGQRWRTESVRLAWLWCLLYSSVNWMQTVPNPTLSLTRSADCDLSTFHSFFVVYVTENYAEHSLTIHRPITCHHRTFFDNSQTYHLPSKNILRQFTHLSLAITEHSSTIHTPITCHHRTFFDNSHNYHLPSRNIIWQFAHLSLAITAKSHLYPWCVTPK